MTVLRAPMPVVTVHRDTLLNADLSTTSRLLYAVLLASLDDVDLTRVARLVGVDNTDSLQPFLDELAGTGMIEVKEHVGQGQILTVHELPLVPAQRSHPCVPCESCGDCSCEYTKGLCRPCSSIRDVTQQAKNDIARWQSQVDAGATYAIGQHATRLHRWNCPTLNTPEKGLARLEDAKSSKENVLRGGLWWSRLPDLYTAEELRQKGVRKKHCATCGPDPL